MALNQKGLAGLVRATFLVETETSSMARFSTVGKRRRACDQTLPHSFFFLCVVSACLCESVCWTLARLALALAALPTHTRHFTLVAAAAHTTLAAPPGLVWQRDRQINSLLNHLFGLVTRSISVRTGSWTRVGLLRGREVAWKSGATGPYEFFSLRCSLLAATGKRPPPAHGARHRTCSPRSTVYYPSTFILRAALLT